MLTDMQWSKIEPLLPGRAGSLGRRAKDNRLFVEAVFWIARTNSPWSHLPAELGNWHSTYMRCIRWCDSGIWDRIVQALAGEAELGRILIDSPMIQAAHRRAALRRKRAKSSSPRKTLRWAKVRSAA
ncbi:MAG: transposase [Zoogloeaceae bacterium]|jgi:putative transposase|nr:transposase [Zoogloeaceae bacterium]